MLDYWDCIASIRPYTCILQKHYGARIKTGTFGVCHLPFTEGGVTIFAVTKVAAVTVAIYKHTYIAP